MSELVVIFACLGINFSLLLKSIAEQQGSLIGYGNQGNDSIEIASHGA